MKTSELTGAALDWAVGLAQGFTMNPKLKSSAWISYSTDWAAAGPIIDRERIGLTPMPDGSWKSQGQNLRPHFHNPTPLIAAMRCYVASKLGNEIQIPEGL